MELYLEIFFSKIVDGKIVYARNFINITQEGSNPDSLVYKALGSNFPRLRTNADNLLIHSTSRRYEDANKLVLTYIVYSDELSFNSRKFMAIPVDKLRVVFNDDPKVPRPKVVEEHSIISHGFRHLSFLVKNDPVIRRVISTNLTTLKIFDEISMALSGLLVV